ncbi:hypothetical protein [Thermomonas sp.]|uniref:hypothetical protein n=1 Tax=Thermomonas sp. TaxID=1971895 RepID=UPI0035AEC3D1
MNASELRDFGPFVQECAKRGIKKTRAYALASSGLLETDYVGKTRIVYLDSLLSLPQRLKAEGRKEAA